MYLHTLTLANQAIHLFDLAITTNQRHRRRSILDSELTDYFFDHEQTSYIYHQAGKPASLRLEPLVLQSLSQPKAVARHDYQLAISYALPLVAVSWAKQPIAVDICQVSAFEDMSDSEIEDFCELYLPNLLKSGVPNPSDLATHWSVYEAQLKALNLPLQEFDSDLAQQFSQLTTVSESFVFQNQRYVVSLSQSKYNAHYDLMLNDLTQLFKKIA